VAQYADRICYVPGSGQPLLTGLPREVLAQIDLAPPLAQLGRSLNWQPLPLTIKEGRSFVADLKSRLDHKPPFPNKAPKKIQSGTEPAIALKNVWYRYEGYAEALKDVNLTIQRGERVVLMGRNGSGKSTLLKNIVGLLYPQQGKVNILGRDTRQTALLDITRRVGFVPQNPGRLLFHDTVAEELAFTRQAHQLPPTDFTDLRRSLGLAELTRAYPRDLSSGERQRVALAAVLAAEPEILLLDEPTRGLDYQNKVLLTRILNDLSERQITIIMATHDVELVAHCADRVIIMAEGQVVVDGPVREVMTGSLIFTSQINKLLRDNRFLTVEDVLQACDL
jgi:energy-coupling factor transport system ATP-binding protein